MREMAKFIQQLIIKFRNKFKTKQLVEIAGLREIYGQFYHQNFHPLKKYSQYLLKQQQTKLEYDLSDYLHHIRKYRFWYKDLTEPLKKRIAHDGITITNYNENFLVKHRKRYADFFAGKESGAKIGLNEEQINAILINEKNNILVAGPGSGKTRVIIERVAFYILKKQVPPEQILILTFNTSAAEEVKQRLHNIYNIDDVEIRTFHSLGLKLINQFYKTHNRSIKIESNSKRVIVQKINELMTNYFQFQLDYNSYFRNNLLRLDFAEYHKVSQQILDQQAAEKYNTIDGTLVKSIAERDIANFFIRNGITYEYETLADWCDQDESPVVEFYMVARLNLAKKSNLTLNNQATKRVYHPDFYLPDYDIYLEHWAISENGTPPEWFGGDPTEYASQRLWKRSQFLKYKKILWETNYLDWRTGKLELKLSKYCKKHAIPLNPISREDLLEQVGKVPEDMGILNDMIASYIQTAKNCGFNSRQFETKVYQNLGNLPAKDIIFFYLVMPIFNAYDALLDKNQKIDFDDMINHAFKFLKGMKEPSTFHQKYPGSDYSMVFVDEFQDISLQRYYLLQEIMRLNPDAHLFCVGDDWQAIYGFTGASNTFLTQYDTYFQHVELNFLQNNYRNVKSIINFGQGIIENTSDFLEKEFVPHNNSSKDAIFIKRLPLSDSSSPNSHQAVGRSTHLEYMELQADYVKNLIIKLTTTKKVPPQEIMVLSRFRFGLTQVKEMCEQEPTIPVALIKQGSVVKEGVRFYTVHKSKGLEADVVIILNVNKGKYGFPSEIETSVNYRFINDTLPNEEDEEARLFYVGLTRARYRVYLITKTGKESAFIGKKPNPLEVLYRAAPRGHGNGFVVIDTEGEQSSFFSNQVFLKILLPNNESAELRIPRSAITIYENENQAHPDLKHFLIQRWWLEKQLGINNLSLRSTKSHQFKFPEKSQLAEIRSKYPNAYKKWSYQDDLLLTKKFQQGATVIELCRFFQRQRGAIRFRLRKLGLQ
jgi:DNA helicase IV